MQGSGDPIHARLEVIRRNGDLDGENPPLLFVHGAWHGAWCWDRGFLGRVSRQGFDVFAVSLRGHGKSAGHERLRTTRVRDFVDDIEEIADRLRAPPVIVGHSMGGFLTQKLMERRRLPGAALLASMPPNGVAEFVGKLIRTDPVGALQANLTLQLKPVVSTPDRVKRLFFSELMSDEDVDLYASKLGNEAFLAYLDMLFGDLCSPAKGTPVLVLGAANDAIFPVHTQKRIAASYGTEAVIFPMAHDMMLEPGWERVADTIALWVREGCRQRFPLAA
ncbi:alpha/beta hydrolase [Methylocystis sp. JAN1]|uniref:alpha/beta hydrolase n=1 Tax=Methylocystis sp. JAN1 TaxID=3397211 RepID=UPI003FA25B4D